MNNAKSKQLSAVLYVILITAALMAISTATVAAAPSSKDQGINRSKATSITTDIPVITGEADSDALVLAPEERAMVRLINQERVEAGLEKLEIDPSLVKLAREKSQDMVSHNYFGHISERLGSVYEQLDREKIPYQTAAENLVGAPDCFKAHTYLMRSPAHRGNLLNAGFKKMGIGIIKGGPYGKMITQILLAE